MGKTKLGDEKKGTEDTFSQNSNDDLSDSELEANWCPNSTCKKCGQKGHVKMVCMSGMEDLPLPNEILFKIISYLEVKDLYQLCCWQMIDIFTQQCSGLQFQNTTCDNGMFSFF